MDFTPEGISKRSKAPYSEKTKTGTGQKPKQPIPRNTLGIGSKTNKHTATTKTPPPLTTQRFTLSDSIVILSDIVVFIYPALDKNVRYMF